MPAKEIKELRQSGKLEEALAMAQNELNAQPNNIWGKRNISWVYYEYLKKYVQEVNFDGFIENLIKIKDLNLPEAEVMIFDTSAYQVASMLFKIQSSEPIIYSKVNQIFDIIKEFHFTYPSEGYSLLMKAFHKGSENWSRFIEFMDWWGLENLSDVDYKQEDYNDRKLPALADKVYGTYCKKLITGEAVDTYGTIREVDQEKIKLFLPQLDKVIDKHPEYRYLPYYKAQMLLKLGNRENVLEAFLPFAKQKQNDFWVWGLMAEIFKDDKELQFSCYCKALSLRTPNEFLIKTRQVLAKLLIERNLYEEAKVEIKNIISVRQSKGWRIPNEVVLWTEKDWYKSASSLKSNKKLYDDHLEQAEEILFQDIPEELIVVEFVNSNKHILNFIKNKNLHGFFNYKGTNIKPEIGDILSVRLTPIGKEGFYRAQTIKTVNDIDISEVESIKQFKGVVRKHPDKDFGFIEDIFISPEIMKFNNLHNKDRLEGIAILSFNKKKNEWGWKCFETTPI